MSNYSPATGFFNPYAYMNPMPSMPQAMQPAQMPQPMPYQNFPLTQSQMQQQSQQQAQQTVLNGKFVDSEDILKVTEIPMGGYGIFPKADFSEIYFKYWTKEGKTDILKFLPVVTETQPSEQEVAIQQILEKVDRLESQLNSFFKSSYSEPVSKPAEPAPAQPIQKREVQINEY